MVLCQSLSGVRPKDLLRPDSTTPQVCMLLVHFHGLSISNKVQTPGAGVPQVSNFCSYLYLTVVITSMPMARTAGSLTGFSVHRTPLSFSCTLSNSLHATVVSDTLKNKKCFGFCLDCVSGQKLLNTLVERVLLAVTVWMYRYRTCVAAWQALQSRPPAPGAAAGQTAWHMCVCSAASLT